MFDALVKLTVLFLVIFDPLVSLIVFLTATKGMKSAERHSTAFLAVLIAGSVSFLFLLFGEALLGLLNTSMANFRVAGGLMLGILGLKMSLGQSLSNLDKFKGNSGKALASVIGTPLLSGPAAISAIIISTADYSGTVTGMAVAIVLVFTLLLLYFSERLDKFIGVTMTQVLSTILGLITLAWGVEFILAGLGV